MQIRHGLAGLARRCPLSTTNRTPQDLDELDRALCTVSRARCTDEQREKVESLLTYNRTLARAYQIKEELRDVLHAPDRPSLEQGLKRIPRRTQARNCKPLRALHDSLRGHWDRIVALGEHHPATGRTEALNNNWEALVRRARGYRDHAYLLLKLRFMTANPIRTRDGVTRFLALGLPTPMRQVA